MLKKLRRRFFCINMAIVAGMLLIIFGLVLHFTASDLERQSNAMLVSAAQGSMQRPGDQKVQLPYFTIQFNIWGEVTASGNTHYDLTDSEFLQELIQEVYTSNQASGKISRYSLKYMVLSGSTVQKIVFLDVSSQNAALMTLLESCIVIGVLALAIFAFISVLLARWAVKPVEQAWQQQKQFVSDASHELKTPLAVILSNTELLQGGDCDQDVRRQYAENIYKSSTQMRRLVESLLELARADNGQLRSAFSQMDLSKTISDGVLPFEAMFFENGLQLSSQIQDGIQIRGSAAHLGQLVGILLDNAQKYSAPGLVQLKLMRHGKNQCILTVSNPGTPIPRGELKRIFERFYRTDSARGNTGSFGLGLSIAQRIVTEHGGQIYAESNATGNCFTVILPCLPE